MIGLTKCSFLYHQVLNPDKVVDSSNDDMAWKADPHGFYQSSKNSNFTTLRFSDVDVSDVSEGEEKSDDGRFSKGDSDEIADGDRLKYDESSNGRYKRDITEVDLPDLTDNANKTKGNKIFPTSLRFRILLHNLL